jgi:flagellar motor switch/type III secretory pathway protein FliN
MADGKVLGLHQGQLIEYDAETKSPLGVGVNEKKLGNRTLLVIQEEETDVVLLNKQ